MNAGVSLAWCLLPILLSAAFGLLAPVLSRRLPPALATWFLSGGGLLAAVISSVTLGLVAFRVVAQAPALAQEGHWSGRDLARLDTIGDRTSTVALLLLAVVVVRVSHVLVRRSAAVRDAYRLAADLPDAGGDLVVMDAPELSAWAVPGRPGRIVVTSALLRSLDGAERRAVLGHERSHLQHHHYLHQLASHVAFAANPFVRLGPAAAASCERWADEDAARVSSRQAVAAALSRAGGGGGPSRVGSVVLAGLEDVAARVVALRQPPVRASTWRVAVLAGLLGVATLAVVVAARDTERLFELARLAYRARHG